MAFNLALQTEKKQPEFAQVSPTFPSQEDDEITVPKLSDSQLNKLAKSYPTWLRDSSAPKNLPGIYHGVLGQVQLQTGLPCGSSQKRGKQKLLFGGSQSKQTCDYMNRFTHTQRVHQLLSASRLSNETLAMIWAHVNKTFPGRLTNREVCLALALVAIFQKFEKDGIEILVGQKNDPFNEIKLEKKPPVPVLYPANETRQTGSCKSSPTRAPCQLSNSERLLIDIDSDVSVEASAITDLPSNKKSAKASSNVTAISLIDSDGVRPDVHLANLCSVWLRFLAATKTLFKRSFDILNVENSRQSALEALRSQRGQLFARNLCLCYPLAHNIKFKFDELSGVLSDACNQQPQETPHNHLGDYAKQLNDLMISVNEYWAVILNLFNESGQTKFIEFIMDGLNYTRRTVSGRTLDELAREFDGSDKPDVCSICHTKFYLVNSATEFGADDNALGDLPNELLADLVGNETGDKEKPTRLLTRDGCIYYHAMCANFWLNHVDGECLPFCKLDLIGCCDILKPSSC